jgi:hypothetical protein
MSDAGVNGHWMYEATMRGLPGGKSGDSKATDMGGCLSVWAERGRGQSQVTDRPLQIVIVTIDIHFRL